MEIAITAIGTATPPYRREQQETAALISAGLGLKMAEKRLLKSIYRSTGIAYRQSVLSDYCKNAGEFEFFPNDPAAAFPTTKARMAIYKKNALPLALTAINNCLIALPEFDKRHITHVITISCTGMYAPGLDIEIIQHLNLNSHTQRTAINFMGCYGAFNGMKVANAICKSQPTAKILMVCVELCTIHFQNNMTLPHVIANSIFSDGAAAILIEANPDRKKYFSFTSFYCDILPQTSAEMAWQIADFGFDIVLSSYVPEIIQSGIANFAEKLYQQAGDEFSKIDLYAIHPGGLKILQACEAALNISKADNQHAYAILRDFGNMSSATILFVLQQIWQSLAPIVHQKNIFSCAFGPGLTLESMLLKTHYIDY